MAARFAKNTSVSVSKTQFEIKDLVQRYGASSFQLGEMQDKAAVMFDLRERRVRFILPLPDRNAHAFCYGRVNQSSAKILLPPEAATVRWEQACRQRWRALFLCIKAKLEAVETGITEFDDEFMANVVMPDGRTIGEHVRPQIAVAYRDKTMPPLIGYSA